ncbi:thioesterase II family protein [Rhodococcus sp. NPDC058521]|uniref:thioesterase II family protein n=1 Tax=Rhodococcus sp. NPDC058521 TaxID=3346536 RepID=UPI00366511C2
MKRWLRRHITNEGELLRRVVCFPHAGGTAGTFSRWPQLLPAGTETVVVQYPGRQDRISEPCIEDMNQMADALTAEIADLTDLPIVLFGHSMGSAVAYEVAVRMERDLAYPADALFVSGRTAPHRRPGETNHLLGDEDLIAALRQLGGDTAGVYDLPKLWPLILPPLRSDLRLLNGHRPRHLTPLRTPIVALGGDSDHTCSLSELEAWGDATTLGVAVHAFPGGHHYLMQHEEAVVGMISRHSRSFTAPR